MKAGIRRELICGIIVAVFVVIGIGWVRFAAIDTAEKQHRSEAQLSLSYLQEDISSLLQFELNGARDIALALTDNSSNKELFDKVALDYMTGNEGVVGVALLGDKKVISAYPENDAITVGMSISELPYIFNMAGVTLSSVVEGPDDYMGLGQDQFIFFWPLISEAGVYQGQAVVGRSVESVLANFGLNRLVEEGYDYELWRVNAQDGSRVVVSSSVDQFDYSLGERTTLTLPSEWTLVVMPREGWATADERALINGFAAAGGVVALIATVALLIISVFYRKQKQACFVDSESGLRNREGFTRDVGRLIDDGTQSVALIFFVVDDYSRVSQLASKQARKAYLVAAAKHVNDSILSSHMLARFGEGCFCVAIEDEVSERELFDLGRRLAMELVWKTEAGGRKVFQNVSFEGVRYPQDGSSAQALIDLVIRDYYDRIAKESPIKLLTGKCRRLAQGAVDVEFEGFSSTEMMRLSESIAQYKKHVDQFLFWDQALHIGSRRKYLRDAEMMIDYDRKRPFVLYCVDIKSFGRTNELFGAPTGDRILSETSVRLRRIFGDNLYRVNGDVFLGIERSTDACIDQTLAAIAECFSEMLVDDIRLKVEFRCGVCSYPRDGKTPELLLECAQAALRYAKSSQSDERAVVYDETLTAVLKDEAHVLELLEKSIEEKTLEVWYQPIMDLRSGKFETAEALLRLKDENGSYLPAAKVVAIAEKNRIIERVDEYVRASVSRFIVTHSIESGLRCVGTNISVQELLIEGCAEDILSNAKDMGVDPGKIALELTETVLIESFDRIVPVLKKLRGIGFTIVLDDFGAGYSSLNYFSSLPIDALKIDKAITRRVLESQKQSDLLKAIVEMARINDILVVVEGVETAEERAAVVAIGADCIQGYYYTKPLPEQDVLKFLDDSLSQRTNEQGT